MVGSVDLAALMAACTSRAAPLMSRSSSNCKMTLLDPCELLEVISVMPAMRPSALSRGVATVVAMISGLAPGRRARTTTTGKSISGRGATGRVVKAMLPARAMAMVKSVVATGRRIKGAEMLKGTYFGPMRLFLPASSPVSWASCASSAFFVSQSSLSPERHHAASPCLVPFVLSSGMG